MATTTTLPAGAAPPADRPPRWRRRPVAMTVWAAGFVAAWLVIGLPTDPIYLLAWMWTGAVAWRISEPWRVHLLFVRTWLPIVLLLVGYNISRGFAATSDPYVRELIVADRWMFGWLTDGQVPTVWMQQQWYDPDQVHWYDVVASWVYFSHFVLTFGIALVLWLRNRQRCAAFMRRFLFLCGAGLVTYFLFPAAPPWWAYEQGHLPEVARVSARGWSEIGLHGAFTMLNSGQLVANPVAAMPSLHTAWAVMAVGFFLPAVRRRWWPLLLAYPVAMGLTLVYTGEHYVIDVLVGAVYVLFAVVAVRAGERWWERWRQRRADRSARQEPGPVPLPRESD